MLPEQVQSTDISSGLYASVALKLGQTLDLHSIQKLSKPCDKIHF